MKMFLKNEKGLTAIETLFSFIILITALIVFYSFLNGYYYKKNEVGESLTAKTLAIKAIEKEANELRKGNIVKSFGYDEAVKVKKTYFKTVVSINDISSDVAYYSDEFKIFEVKATVYWKKRKFEVKTYVDQDRT